MPLARFAFDTGADFIDVAAENGGQSKDAADALVDEILRVADAVKCFRLPVPAGETPGVIA